jgi:DNA-binding response OmpR family regulator/anti-sigma regulatory factor (Ser/Thr protein kinase)
MNPAPVAPTTILTIDDDARVRETLDQLLTCPQNQLAFASSGEEGLRRASELKPDLILLDVMMPGMDGFEVSRRVRADAALAEIPVLMITALDDRNSRLKGIEAGADDFIQKPFDSTELRARVRTITGLSRYRKLVAGRARAQWLMDNSQDATLVVDPLLFVRYMNRAARKLMQLRPGEIPEPHLMEMLCKHFRCEPRQAWATWLEQPATAPRPPLLLFRPATASAPLAWHEVWVLGATDTGLAPEFILQIRDVTRVIQERLNGWSFERSVSHKLATPLTGVMGFVDILRREMLPQIRDAEVIQYLDLLGKSADRLHGAVMDVLRYAEVANQPAEPQRFSIAQLPAVIGTAAAGTGVSDLEVDLAVTHQDLHVPLSEQTVELILTQLFENAVKFHPRRQPKIKLSATCNIQRQGVVLRVEDDGVTLSSEQLEQVWKPYFQAEKTLTGQIPGMGLGLSNIAMLVAQAGGESWMENVAGAPGVIVCLMVPICPASTTSGPAAESASRT